MQKGFVETTFGFTTRWLNFARFAKNNFFNELTILEKDPQSIEFFLVLIKFSQNKGSEGSD